MSKYKTILTEINQNVGLITLNRPDSYNALNLEMLGELMTALNDFDTQEEIGVMLITGTPKFFAAGADITNMVDANEEEIRKSPFIHSFGEIQNIKKPLIAAVAGFCLGGGLELAMSCDLITAAENSKFGQPEINLGVIPGAGGTQRLTRAVGKAIAMEMVLNNRTMTAAEALDFGLINHIYSQEDYLDQSIKLAQQIAERAPIAIIAAKRAVNLSFEFSLQNGLAEEQDIFFSLFSSQDQKEGMKAFLEKREPDWQGK